MKNTYFFIFYTLFTLSSCANLLTPGHELKRDLASENTCTSIVGNFLRTNQQNNQQLELLFDKIEGLATRLYSTSGFKNKEQLLKAIEKSTLSAKKAAQILLEEKLEIVMAVPMDRRDSIINKGFLNYLEAKNSQGSVIGRDLIEANYASMKIENYSELSSFFKPKYAYIGPRPGDGLTAPVGIQNYGSDHFIFDLNKIRNRITFTIGDSLNRHKYFTGGNYTPITSWDQLFMPWSKRELAIAAVAKGVEDSKLGMRMEIFKMSIDELQREFPFSAQSQLIQLGHAFNNKTKVEWTAMETGVSAPEGLENYRLAWDASLDYIEVQIWDNLTLDDVRAFEYTEKKPEGEFLKELQLRNIEIRDGRKKGK